MELAQATGLCVTKVHKSLAAQARRVAFTGDPVFETAAAKGNGDQVSLPTHPERHFLSAVEADAWWTRC